MSTFDRVIGRRLLSLHQAGYELSGGRWGHRLGPYQMLLLRTRGRKTGQTRTAALLYLEDAGRYVVVGSKGGSDEPPAWLGNLRRQPRVEVQVGTRQFPARAEVAGPQERARLWPAITALNPAYERYQRQTRREIPLVILSPA